MLRKRVCAAGHEAGEEDVQVYRQSVHGLPPTAAVIYASKHSAGQPAGTVVHASCGCILCRCLHSSVRQAQHQKLLMYFELLCIATLRNRDMVCIPMLVGCLFSVVLHAMFQRWTTPLVLNT